MNDNCIFCSLAKDSPHIIFEDELCYVVPDRFPSEYGHLLVISKEHNDNMLVAPDSTVSDMFLTAKRIGLMEKGRLGAKSVAIETNIGKEAGQVIFHFHIHVVPKYDAEIKGFIKHKELGADGASELIKKLKS